MQATSEMLTLILLKSFTSMRKALTAYSEYLKMCSDDRHPQEIDPRKIVEYANAVKEINDEIVTYTQAIVNTSGK